MKAIAISTHDDISKKMLDLCSSQLKKATGLTLEVSWFDSEDMAKARATGIDIFGGTGYGQFKLDALKNAAADGKFLYVDTDVVFIKPWDVSAYEPNNSLFMTKAAYKDNFYNTGVMIGDESSIPLFQKASEIVARFGDNDEPAINEAINTVKGITVVDFPDGINTQMNRRIRAHGGTMVRPEVRDVDIALHFLGRGQKLHVMEQYVSDYSSI